MQTENEKAVRGQKELWLVLDETGEPIHCASWPSACHEHINDAINEFQIEGADKWRVIQAAPKAPQKVSNTPQDGKLREFAVMFLAFIGRDRGTDRLDASLEGLTKLAQEALSTPPQQQEQKHGSAGSSPLDPSGEAGLALTEAARRFIAKVRIHAKMPNKVEAESSLLEAIAAYEAAKPSHSTPTATASQESAPGQEAVAWVEMSDAVNVAKHKRIIAPNLDNLPVGAKLYLAPPLSAPAIEAAAIMRAAAAVACPGRTIFDTEKAILALIPQDGRTALEEFGMKVATETRSAVLINTREDLFTEDSSLRAIVSQTIDKINAAGMKEGE